MAKSQQIVTSKSDIPGIQSDINGFIFAPNTLIAGDHFFIADDFRITRKGDMVVILFGTVSSFSKSNSFNLALELSLPIRLAVDFLYKTLWERPSTNSEKTLADILKENVGLDKKIFGDDGLAHLELEIPSDPSNYRKFPANFVTCSISNGQAMLEFFEASPDVLVSLYQRKSPRPGAAVKSIVSVILSPALLLIFLEESKKILQPFKQLSAAAE